LEDDVAGFLGVLMNKLDGERIELTQTSSQRESWKQLGLKE